MSPIILSRMAIAVWLRSSESLAAVSRVFLMISSRCSSSRRLISPSMSGVSAFLSGNWNL
jgi:hypothetical protein